MCPFSSHQWMCVSDFFRVKKDGSSEPARNTKEWPDPSRESLEPATGMPYQVATRKTRILVPSSLPSDRPLTLDVVAALMTCVILSSICFPRKVC